MRAMKSGSVAAVLAGMLFISAVPPLRAQDAAPVVPASYGEGRIVRPDGSKLRVASFDLESARVSYRPTGGSEAASFDLSQVKLVQVRTKPTFGSVSRAFLWGTLAGGVVSLIAANPWGGPWKDTWPAIGALTLASATTGALIVWIGRHYRTVYANPDYAAKPVIKLEMGAVAPRTPGLSLSIAF